MTIKCVSFEFEDHLLGPFKEFPFALYDKDPSWHISAEKENFLLSPQNPLYKTCRHKKFLVFDEEKNVLARCMAIIHPQIQHQKKICGQLAFWETQKNLEASALMFKKVDAWFKEHGIDTIIGPMNFTTWHSYRLKTDQFEAPPYLFEPYNKSYYPFLLEKLGYAPFKSYFTFDVDHKDKVFPKEEEITHNLKEKQLTIRPISLSKLDEEIDKIYALSLLCFKDNFLYTPIEKNSFKTLYQSIKSVILPQYFLMVENSNQELVGFVFGLPNYFKALKAMNGKDHLWAKCKFLYHKNEFDTIMVKTLATHPDYRNQQIGKALMGVLHQQAKKNHVYKIQHCLVMEDNFSGRYNKDYQMDRIRTYQLYKKQI